MEGRVAWREIDKVRKKGIKFSLSELNNKRGRNTGEKNRLGKPVKSAQGERDPGLLSRKKSGNVHLGRQVNWTTKTAIFILRY